MHPANDEITRRSSSSRPPGPPGGGRRRTLLLLAPPVLGTAAVPLYSRSGPDWAGVPFYWYQLAWLPLSILVMALFLRLSDRDDGDR